MNCLPVLLVGRSLPTCDLVYPWYQVLDLGARSLQCRGHHDQPTHASQASKTRIVPVLAGNLHPKTYAVSLPSVEPRQLALKYGMRIPESGDDGKEENDGMLVLRIVTVKYPSVWYILKFATIVESRLNYNYSSHV